VKRARRSVFVRLACVIGTLGCFRLFLQVAGEFLPGELDIALVRNVVTVEHTARFVAAYPHGLFFGTVSKLGAIASIGRGVLVEFRVWVETRLGDRILERELVAQVQQTAAGIGPEEPYRRPFPATTRRMPNGYGDSGNT
jgi:hypothetical protein